jgi:hypothetical protein
VSGRARVFGGESFLKWVGVCVCGGIGVGVGVGVGVCVHVCVCVSVGGSGFIGSRGWQPPREFWRTWGRQPLRIHRTQEQQHKEHKTHRTQQQNKTRNTKQQQTPLYASRSLQSFVELLMRAVACNIANITYASHSLQNINK